MVVEAGLAGALSILRLAPAGLGDQQHRAAPGLGTDAPASLQAVLHRHAQIEQCHVGAVPFGQRQGLRTVESHIHLMPQCLQQLGKTLSRVAQVVGHQHPARCGAGRGGLGRGRQLGQGVAGGGWRRPRLRLRLQRVRWLSRGGSGRHGRLRGGHRQAHGEGAALPRPGTAGAERAAMHQHQPARQRQSDAQAAVGSVRRLVHLAEHLEDVAQVLGGDADAVVADGDLQQRAALRGLHRDAPARWCVLGGIDEQVGQYLGQSRHVGVDEHRLVRQCQRELVAGVGEQRLRQLKRTLDRAGDVQPLEAQCERLVHHARDIEQVFQQTGHLRDLTVHHVAAPVALGGVDAGHAQQAQRVADRRQRVAQLVRQHGDEIVLAAVGLVQRQFGQLACGDVHRHAVVAQRQVVGAVLGLAVVVDPHQPAVGVHHAKFMRDWMAQRDRLLPQEQKLGAVVGMHQRGHAAAGGLEVLRIDAEHAVGLLGPPQHAAHQVEVEHAHAARLQHQGQAFTLDAQPLFGQLAIGDVGNDADQQVCPAVGQPRQHLAPARQPQQAAVGVQHPIVGGERILLVGQRMEAINQVAVVGVQRTPVFVVVAADLAARAGQLQAEQRHALGRPLPGVRHKVGLPGSQSTSGQRGAVAGRAVVRRRDRDARRRDLWWR